MGALQPGHLIVVLVIVLLLFGPGKLPELGKAVGDGLRELKKATGGDESKDANTASATTTATPPTTTLVTPINPPPALVTRACPTCRGAVPIGDKFCGHCGGVMEPVSRSA
jgi:sec-independent protein translocase protein TatA